MPPLLVGLLPIIDKIFGNLFPDPDKKNEALIEFVKQISTANIQELQAQSEVIQSEAKSESWLAVNWRPLTMMVFLGLVVSYWFGYYPPNMTEAIIIKLFDIIQMGLSGYVVGRSAEKVAELWSRSKKDKS